jgi:type IV pilus assembly protein PilE
MKHRQPGFTLIELMIVVAVIGILAAIAYPSYTQYVVAGNRRAGAACLIEASQWMERYYTTNLSYTGATLPAMGCRTEVASNYTIAVTGVSASAFSATATPIGTQATKDTRCGTLSVNQAGVRGETGTGTVTDCF